MNNLISLSVIKKRIAKDLPYGNCNESTVRRLWWAALETLQEDILLPMNIRNGIWLSAPLPALYQPKLLKNLRGWVWAPKEFSKLQAVKSEFLLPSNQKNSEGMPYSNNLSYMHLPLRDEDGDDPLLIILASKIQVALTIFGPPNQRNLAVTSNKKTMSEILRMLDSRLRIEDTLESNELREDISGHQLSINNPDLEKVFWPFLSSRLATMAPSLNLQTLQEDNQSEELNSNSSDISLLEAITHEVRTPLATIRTLIRSLLRRKDLNSLVINRLKQIDSECTEQIDRFGLIFNAAELQRQSPEASRLASTDLGRMLIMLQPSWSELLERRGIKLVIDITPDLPQVLSDPERLELMLGGLIDKSTRGLQQGGTLALELRPAGHRLKLQILSKSVSTKTIPSRDPKKNSDLGAVLSWDPSTGSLQLSHKATQKLLASLGGRMTHRRDSVLTVFFPLAEVKH